MIATHEVAHGEIHWSVKKNMVRNKQIPNIKHRRKAKHINVKIHGPIGLNFTSNHRMWCARPWCWWGSPGAAPALAPQHDKPLTGFGGQIHQLGVMPGLARDEGWNTFEGHYLWSMNKSTRNLSSVECWPVKMTVDFFEITCSTVTFRRNANIRNKVTFRRNANIRNKLADSN